MDCGKKKYSLAEAGHVINLAKKNRRLSTFRGDKRPIRKYWCPDCNAYHVTSERKRNEKKEYRPLPEC